MDFLTPNVNQIRHSIKDIDDSYSHDWDILAELLQNSVDAIRENEPASGLIQIEINKDNHSLKVYDNGIGIESEILPEILRPFCSGKMGKGNLIGEKGVGLTFSIFSANGFRIETVRNGMKTVGKIQSAFDWKGRSDDSVLGLTIETTESNSSSSTEIELTDIKNEAIFQLTDKQLEFVLRTRTVIGSTANIFQDEKEKEIYVRVSVISQGEKSESVVKNVYLLPTEVVSKGSREDLADFVNWTKAQDRTDSDKRTKLKDKIIYRSGTYDHNPVRVIKYFACFVPQLKTWDEISSKFLGFNIMSEEKSEFIEQTSYARFTSGIFASVKTMPTGIPIQQPTTGSAGYWGRFFILLEDNYLKFDIGRKSIHGKQQNILRECSKFIFNDFLKYVSKYVAGNPEYVEQTWQREDIIAEIEGLIDIGSTKVNFKKNPHKQEASVAAIFYERIGNGLIKGIRPVLSGYHDKYDLFAEWNNRKLFIEFKTSISNLKKDFSDARKIFDEMDCLVCGESPMATFKWPILVSRFSIFRKSRSWRAEINR